MIAVVVINFGSPDLTIRFVKNECAKIQTEYAVIVVDNASTDESYTLLTKELPQAHILRCFDNQGFARGNNQGAEYAISLLRPSHILFSNNDILFKDENVVDALLTQMIIHPEVGIMGPQVLGLDGSRQSPNPEKSFAQCYIIPTWGRLIYKKETLNKILKADYRESAQAGPCAWVSGCFFMVNACYFEKVRGFDPGTFLYGEEQILSARFYRIGKSVYFYPQVTVIHEHGLTSHKYFSKVSIRLMTFESLSYFYRKYVGTPAWVILFGKITMWINILRGK